VNFESQQLLVTLLVKVGVVASLASILIRAGSFKHLLFRAERDVSDKLQLGAFFGATFSLGVVVRLILRYKAPDVSLEGALLAGLLGGHIAGALAGAVIALPAFFSGELVAPLVLPLVGLAGGVARRLCPQADDVWHFSPFVDMNIYRWYQRRFGKPRGDWQMMVFLFIVALEMWYLLLGRAVHGHLLYRAPAIRHLFYLDSESNLLKAAIVVAGVACVAIPIKIWNNTRNELIVEEQGRLLVEARMAALTSQINPHFLFNTLNSISSLIRIDPERAREMIRKLSSILRRLLRRQDAFAPLREELQFIDDYLDIEVVRFGPEKLQVVKEIDDRTLDMHVPTMVLQPLLENSIKHGLGRLVSGGIVRIRSICRDGGLLIEVEDNGEGIDPNRGASDDGSGIGLSNVQERLKLLYGADFGFRISSRPGQGTLVQIELPDVGEVAPAPLTPPPLARTQSRG